MPEVAFSLRWPDGTSFDGTSPSRAIERHIVAGARYPTAELVRRVQAGLAQASDRVHERYGHACTLAAGVSLEIGAQARRFADEPDSWTTVTRVARHLNRPAFPAPEVIDGHVDVAIVGGGQAGLAVSWFLREHGIEHQILERDVIASAWRQRRWDEFCLVTPNFQCRLPGHPYAGPEPDGFLLKDEIVGYVESFAQAFDPPVHEGVEVQKVRSHGDGGFVLSTDRGTLHAGRVILCVGGYHTPKLPPLAAGLPDTVSQLHSSTYKNASSLPDGAVLVVGTGQSGAQITEDLLLGGRDAHLCVGSAPRVARRYRGRDCIAWLEEIGHYRMPIDDHPEGLAARHEPNHYMTGRDGGHDIDLREYALRGVRLHGRLESVQDDGTLRFSGDLEPNLDAADATMDRIKDTIDRYIEAQGLSAPSEERYRPVWRPEGDGSAPVNLHGDRITSVVWATGYDSDWSWLELPLLDSDGYPTHERGVCTRVPGVYVLGLPWLHTWGSGRFAGVTDDAAHVARAIAAQTRGGDGLHRLPLRRAGGPV